MLYCGPDMQDNKATELSVGQVARRSGVAVSAVHFYELKGLIRGRRNCSNQRRYPRDVLRRIAVIKLAQRVGLPLREIVEAFATLPNSRTPTAEDWAELSRVWRDALESRIEELVQLRDDLSNCIGCGCLSIDSCPLYNANDVLGAEGPGARLMKPHSIP